MNTKHNSPDSSSHPMVSVVFPCHNEAEAVGACVKEALQSLKNLDGEVIVVDNNSTDGSDEIAAKAGARVVKEKTPGYGAALLAGFDAAYGDILIMADADGTYPLADIPRFVEKMNEGYDMVMGSRFMGKIAGDAMPLFNRIVGNPMLTGLLNLFYGCRISDTQTGMRAFSKKAYKAMELRSTGMELASEIIIKAINAKLNIAEIPISYAKRIGDSKLSPVRDAWRHIMSIMLYSPTYAFIVPGMAMWLLGLVGTIVFIPGPMSIGAVKLDLHTMTAAILSAVFGINILLIGIIARQYTVSHLGINGGPLTKLVTMFVTPGRLAMTGLGTGTAAVAVLIWIAASWIAGGFGNLSNERLFLAMAGILLMAGQMVMAAFLLTLVSESAHTKT